MSTEGLELPEWSPCTLHLFGPLPLYSRRHISMLLKRHIIVLSSNDIAKCDADQVAEIKKMCEEVSMRIENYRVSRLLRDLVFHNLAQLLLPIPIKIPSKGHFEC